MKIEGKCSEFGGPNDEGMKPEEGLAIYEHHESDLRPDLFIPRGTDQRMGTNTRLIIYSYYIAVRYDHDISRGKLQRSKWLVKNLKTGKSLAASLVDWGPAEWTGRVADLSPGIMRDLELETDDSIMVESLTL